MPTGTFIWEQSVTSGDAYPNQVVSDANGNSYVGGNYALSINFGAGTTANAAGQDAFIVKYDKNKNVVWSNFIQGLSDSKILGVTLDSAGAPIVCGYFKSGTTGLIATSQNGANATLINTDTTGQTSDIFVIKYDSNGNILWYRVFGSNGNDVAWSITVDGVDNPIFVAQITGTVTFDGNPVIGGGYGIAIVKLAAVTGTTVLAYGWSGGSYNFPNDIAIDKDGNILVAGALTFGVANIGSGSNTTLAGAYVAKYDGTNFHYIWGDGYGGTQAMGVTTHPSSGNVIITGDAGGTVNFGGGAHTNGQVCFMVCFSTSGAFIWENYLPVTGGASQGVEVKIDASGNIINCLTATGWFDFGDGQYHYCKGGCLNVYTVTGNSLPVFQWSYFVSDSSTAYSCCFSDSGYAMLGRKVVYNFALTRLQVPLSGGLLPVPTPSDFTPVYAPSANTTFQSKFGFIWNGTLPIGATNILIKYSFPAGTITPGPGETTPFLLLNYPEPSGYFGPNAYGFVYKVTGGDGPTWGPGYTTILNWSWAAAFADSGGAAIGPYTAWQNVTKSAAVNVTNNGTVASTPYANPKVTTNPTNRGNLQSVSLS